MPLITIKVFEDELSNSQAKDLIHKVTEAVIPFIGEKLPDNTWVLIEEIASGSWGIGGRVFGLTDVRSRKIGEPAMKIVSVNVGMPREAVWKGMTVQTAIFKEPVDGPVTISKLNLAGDEPADLTVHGGSDKAVYAYPTEHYEYWREELPEVSFSWGNFGENLTTEGLWEDTVHRRSPSVISEAMARKWWQSSEAVSVALQRRRRDVRHRVFDRQRNAPTSGRACEWKLYIFERPPFAFRPGECDGCRKPGDPLAIGRKGNDQAT